MDKRLTILFSLVFLASCKEMPMVIVPDDDLTAIPYNPEPYPIESPKYFPTIEHPSDNKLTKDGVQLGRFLFYDPILSADSTMSCASCHKVELAFTDGNATSIGIDGNSGKRSSMSLMNVAFTKNGLFWDGRSENLEVQAAAPVIDPVELHNTWENVEEKLQRHNTYPEMFRKAFGISNKTEITKDLATKALSQFERILISANSKYDEFLRGETILTDEEYEGYSLYFDIQGDNIPDAQCNHCHQLDLATGDAFFNNGIQASADLTSFADLGKGKITGNIAENGKFRAVTLRNIMLTAPYMHDGSMATIDEVLQHYVSGGKKSPNRDPLLVDKQLNELNAHQISCIKSFLTTLTDTSSLKNPDFSNPFK